MIDLHIHILPGIDDGPINQQDALAMAHVALADGIRAVVATPHVVPGLYNNNKLGIIEAVQGFQSYLQCSGIFLEVYPGAEYMLEPGLAEGLATGEVLTLADGGRYLLVEFPALGIPVYAEQALLEIALLGVTPVIAHPERNSEFMRHPGKLLPFLERGALCQGTAGSFTGLFGKRVRRVALTYLQGGLYSFVSSDAHNAGSRPPALAEFYALAENYGAGAGKLLTTLNPERLLGGQPLLPLPVLEEKTGREKLWRGFLSKIWGKT